jgi:hypothetical protein
VKKFPVFYGTDGSLPHSQVLDTCPYQSITPVPSLSEWIFRNKIRFYGEELIASPPTPNLEDHPLSTVRDCLFNLFADTLHIGGRYSIRNLGTRHAVVTGTHLSMYRSCNTYRLFQGSFTVICNVGSLSNNMIRNWNRPEIIANSEMVLRIKN